MDKSNIEKLTGDALCVCGHPHSAHRHDHDEAGDPAYKEFCAVCDGAGWPKHCDGFLRAEDASEQTAVKTWLVKNCIQCPRCGGANQGYSTWIIRKGEVACDNCFFPAPTETAARETEGGGTDA